MASGTITHFSTYGVSKLRQGTAEVGMFGTSGRDFMDFSNGQILGVKAQSDLMFEPWFDCFGMTGLTPALLPMSPAVVKDMGAVSLASVTTAPTSGYGFSQTEPAEPAITGHSYAMKTREGCYAKFYMKSITFTDGTYPATFVWDWVYQPDGTTNF